MSKTATARHRAATRPHTPLTTVGAALTGPNTRRAAAAAASSGVVLALTASASLAAPGEVDLSRHVAPMANLTASDGAATSPTITVAADAEWSFVVADVTSEPPPPPPPPPPPVRSPAPTTSSSGGSSTSSAPAVAAPAQGASGSAIVDIARRYIGTPYVYGGAAPGGFDCSGFTSYVYAQLGISLPRTSSAQRYAGTVVSAAEAQPGDLLWAPGHIGIYTGNGNHIAARRPGTALYEGPIYLSNPVFIRVG
ncbi:MAG: C40 family peptidase [Beutenbergiaceae bacterium]